MSMVNESVRAKLSDDMTIEVQASVCEPGA